MLLKLLKSRDCEFLCRRKPILWKAIVDKSGRDYFEDPVFRIVSPDIIPSSEMQNHSMRTDIDLARFLPAGREFFLPDENFLPVEIFFVVREFSGQLRIVFVGREFFFASREICCSILIFAKRTLVSGLYEPLNKENGGHFGCLLYSTLAPVKI